ncbi:MAG: HDOD domain-containing protein [Planctomycetes bacterium]|nr:HDOD domain-containing protein [Planctomycetota bacterium]
MTHLTLNQLAIQEKTRREILHKSELIPPLPDLVVRLLAMLNKQDTEPHHLEDVMQNDQVLVARMLAMVNSPFYGLTRSISTIREAVMVLGFRGVRSLVLASSAAKFMQRDYACYGHEAKGLWLHAASVAAGAKSLARSCGLEPDNSEQLFVGGLLHDIGKLLLAPYLTENHRAVAPGEDVVDLERDLLGLDHTEAGALVTAKWNLSKEIQEVIKAHHDSPTGAEAPNPGASPKSLAIVRLADAIAHERGIGYLPDRSPKSHVCQADLATLSLSEAAWTSLRDEVAAHMDEGVAAIKSLGN